MRLVSMAVVVFLAGALPANAQLADSAGRARECPPCAEWNAPREPFRIHGNTWYVGTDGLAAILVTTPQGHALLDAGLPESAPRIAANIRALGFRVEDVRVILNSHAHYDHAGGIGELQRASGAEVPASAASARMLEAGASQPGDPQYGEALAFPAVANVRVIEDRAVVRVGGVAFTAHVLGGHTPGSTTWSWRSCTEDGCVDVVYADSQTPVSADDFLFTRSETYPEAIADFERSFARLERLPCGILLTPHPGASRLFERQAAGSLFGENACRAYAANARAQLARRIERERSGG